MAVLIKYFYVLTDALQQSSDQLRREWYATCRIVLQIQKWVSEQFAFVLVSSHFFYCFFHIYSKLQYSLLLL